MSELRLGEMAAIVDIVRKVVMQWDDFVGSVEAMSQDYKDLQARYERLRREYQDLREAYERLVRDHESKLQTLAELQSAHEALRRDLESGTDELRKRFEALLHEQQVAIQHLEDLAQRLQP